MKYLLTGSSGFIGSRLLNAINDNVVLLSRNKNSSYPTMICDFEKDEIPSFAFKSVEVVIHLAGLSHDFGDASKIEDLYRKVNIDATVELATLASQNNVKRFVFISSVKAGGKPIYGRCRLENEQDSPDGVYGRTKREAELAILEIGKKTDMHVTVIRPALVYGPNVKGNLKLMLSGIKKGWFPPLPMTNNKRSMIHVDDLVRAILLVKEKGIDGEIYNVTDGKDYSTTEIYETLCELIKKDLPKIRLPLFLLNLLSFIPGKINKTVIKLVRDDRYSSSKIESLGFSAKLRFRDLNETLF